MNAIHKRVNESPKTTIIKGSVLIMFNSESSVLYVQTDRPGHNIQLILL